MCKHAAHPCFYEFLSVSLRPLQIRVSKSQMWRAHPLGKLALNPLGRLPLVLDVLVLAQAGSSVEVVDLEEALLAVAVPLVPLRDVQVLRPVAVAATRLVDVQDVGGGVVVEGGGGERVWRESEKGRQSHLEKARPGPRR